jgi:hypothetical protein
LTNKAKAMADSAPAKGRIYKEMVEPMISSNKKV